MNTIKLYNEAFKKTFGIKETKLKKLKYQDVESWDSVGHMNLMSVLEKKFKIEMNIDDIVDFSSYEKGKKILKKYKIAIK
jgi:acyl carrier protein